MEICSYGTFSLQHRGQEGFGVVAVTGEDFACCYGEGCVSHQQVITRLKGNHALGHVRYSTSGKKFANHTLPQPVSRELSIGRIAIAYNGNLVNSERLRKWLLDQGHSFQSDVDTEVILNLISSSPGNDITTKTLEAIKHIKGGFAITIMTNDTMIGLRDPLGIRPLVLGELGESFIFASESCALAVVGARLLRDVRPGELIVIKAGSEPTSINYATRGDHAQGDHSKIEAPQLKSSFCLFEYVYFARADSQLDGISVYEARKKIGYKLADEETLAFGPNCIVTPIPDSATTAAIGYSQKSRLPMELGIIKNNYVGRTFIEPSAKHRQTALNLKHSINKSIIKGKDLILIDDSIVRGNTMKAVIHALKAAGVKSIHLRIASPAILHPCFYGIDTPDHSQLLANKYDCRQMSEYLGVDSLKFLSVDGLKSAISSDLQYCDACFTGRYPVTD